MDLRAAVEVLVVENPYISWLSDEPLMSADPTAAPCGSEPARECVSEYTT